jgi:Ca2+-binding RTX toxin-like protein
MFVFNRKALAGIGIAAVASTALFSAPAQAAAAGTAKVVGSTTVQFNALSGKTNGLTITISGRTVTLDDKVAIKAGKGCKAVKGDKTKVKCTTSKATKKLNISLGDKNDSVTNKTKVAMLVDGGAGNDKLVGGSGKDELQGKAGKDTLDGKAGNDRILGGADSDRIVGGAGTDELWGDAGIDTITGDAGDDVIFGGAGNDKLSGNAGKDIAFGQAGNDKIVGNAGDDILFGEDLDDETLEQVGSNSAKDVVDGGAADDACFVLAAGTTVNCETVAPSGLALAMTPAQARTAPAAAVRAGAIEQAAALVPAA